MDQAIGGEPIVQQSLGVLEPLLAGGGFQHHGDQLHALPLRRGGNAVSGGVRGPGFQPRGPLIKADELVGVGQLELSVPKGVHPDGGKAPDVRVTADQLPGHHGDVPCAGDVALRRKARAVDEMGVLHPQLPGPVVHLLHKQLRDPRHFFRQGHGGVVAAGHAHPLQQVLHGDLLPGGQKDLAAAHGGGIVADGDHVVIGQGPPVDGLHHQQQGHDLGDAGRFQGLVLVFGVEHLSRLLLHQQRRLRLHRQLHPPGRTQRQQQHQHRQCPQQLFHGKPLPVFSSPYAPGDKKRTPPAGGVLFVCLVMR